MSLHMYVYARWKTVRQRTAALFDERVTAAPISMPMNPVFCDWTRKRPIGAGRARTRSSRRRSRRAQRSITKRGADAAARYLAKVAANFCATRCLLAFVNNGRAQRGHRLSDKLPRDFTFGRPASGTLCVSFVSIHNKRAPAARKRGEKCDATAAAAAAVFIIQSSSLLTCIRFDYKSGRRARSRKERNAPIGVRSLAFGT